MEVTIGAILGFVVGFIVGMLGSVVATGIREMLSVPVLGSKLQASSFRRASDPNFSIWYIGIELKANRFWQLVTTRLEDLRARVVSVQVDGKRTSWQGMWNTGEMGTSSVSVAIGTSHFLNIATEPSSDSLLRPGSEVDTASILHGDQDVEVSLYSGEILLGEWVYKGAIVQGRGRNVPGSKIP